MYIPSYVGKSSEEILAIDGYDSASYMFRAMSWLDYHKRDRKYSSLVYSCSDARLGVEYLLFEQLIISTGANLSLEDYERCVAERNRFEKTIRQLSPDYEKLQKFARVIVELEPEAPKLVFWKTSSLMKAWGDISKYLHWRGARNLSTEDPGWVSNSCADVEKTLVPIWEKMTSGLSGIMHPDQMNPEVREVWERFRSGKIDEQSAKFQLNFIKPLASRHNISFQGTR